MDSREDILAAVKKNQPEWRELPSLPGGGVASGAEDGVAGAIVNGVSATTGGATGSASAADLEARFLSSARSDWGRRVDRVGL